MPVQMEHRLPRPGADVDDDLVVLQPGRARRVRDEDEQAPRLLRRQLADLAERVDVMLRNDEQMGFRLRVDIPDRDEAVGRVDVVAVLVELAEETVVAHAARIPSSVTPAARTRTSRPTSPRTSHGE